jgi:hypothetical protein
LGRQWEKYYEKTGDPGEFKWLKRIKFSEAKPILARNDFRLKYAKNRDDFIDGIAADGSSPDDDDSIVLIYGMNWSATGGRITHVYPNDIEDF